MVLEPRNLRVARVMATLHYWSVSTSQVSAQGLSFVLCVRISQYIFISASYIRSHPSLEATQTADVRTRHKRYKAPEGGVSREPNGLSPLLGDCDLPLLVDWSNNEDREENGERRPSCLRV
jgi:hypothetical protein